MRYDPTFYGGAAGHYRRGRPAYSPRLEALLAEELSLDGSGRLLDVGCGPGILTVRLAHLFGGAVGLDPDPAMIGEGRRAAAERGIANISWIRAERKICPRPRFAAGIPDLRRDIESVVSGYFSMSYAAPHLFGDRAGEFADTEVMFAGK